MSRAWISLGEITRYVSELKDERDRASDRAERAVAQVNNLQDEVVALRAEIKRHAEALATAAAQTGGLISDLSPPFIALQEFVREAPTAPPALPYVCETLASSRRGIPFKPESRFKAARPGPGDVCDACYCWQPATEAVEIEDACPGGYLHLCHEHSRAWNWYPHT